MVLETEEVIDALLVIGIAVYSSCWLQDEQDIIRSCALRLYNSGRYSGSPAQLYLREISKTGIPDFPAAMQVVDSCRARRKAQRHH